MEVRGDLTGTRPVAPVAPVQQVSPVGDLKQDIYARLMLLAVGRPLAAEVMTQNPDGSSMVRVADALVQMDLPDNASVGDKVILTLLAREPRLTFLYERETGTHSLLSNTGRLIDMILKLAAQEGRDASVAGRSPLLQSPPGTATLMGMPGLVSTLQGMLSQLFSASGLFYESHLAQWVAGERTQAQLMEEPQANMRQPEQQVLTQQDQMSRLESLQEKSWLQSLVDKGLLRTSEQAMQKGDMVIDRDAANMIRTQLEALDQRKVVWQGEFWPGQPIEWEISDETPQQDNRPDTEAPRAWQSVLRVDLPNLGEVTATMNLTGERLRVDLKAADPDISAVLRNHLAVLSGSLEAAGVGLEGVQVRAVTTDDSRLSESSFNDVAPQQAKGSDGQD